jgi:hypothetical protein
MDEGRKMWYAEKKHGRLIYEGKTEGGIPWQSAFLNC